MPKAFSDFGMADEAVGPRNTLDTPKYDLGSYLGRVRHFFDVIDPRTLFTSQETLNKSLSLLKAYEEGRVPKSVTDEELWEAKKTKDAIIHPDTGEPIFPLFRMSAFTPVTIPITVGMLLPNPSTATILFWQWVNQSVNVSVNYANRNASNEMSLSQVAQGYSIAVAASCSIAVGLNAFVKRSATLSPGLRTVIQRTVPFVAVASAGASNMYFMRRNETIDGVSVRDAEGNDRGRSKKAGVIGLAQTMASRALFLPAPVLLLPPLLMSPFEKMKSIQSNPRLRLATQVAVVTGVVWTALPCAIALFPQHMEVPVSKLEPEFQNLKDSQGRPVTTLIINKGL